MRVQRRVVRDFHVNLKLQDDVRRWYTQEHLTGEEIGRLVGVSQRSVSRWLKALGITTDDGEHVHTTCAQCAAPVTVNRGRWRKNRRVFCSQSCYYDRRANPDYKRDTYGMRQARKAVMAAGFPLLKGHVVHHHDGDNRNNSVENLAVFESQRDHMRFHHHGDAAPIWDGRQK